MATQSKSFKSYITQLEDFLNLYLVKKAPALPANVKEFIVNFAPWITLILIIIAVPAMLWVLGLGTFLMPFGFMMGPQAGFNYALSFIFSAASIVLEAMAIPGLFKRQKSAWYLVFYADLINVVYNIITLNVAGLIIGSLISFYFLFQVREYYK